MVTPRRQVKIQSPQKEIFSISIIHGGAQSVLKPPGMAGEIIPRQIDITLALLA
jgi:hypothetical protein